LGVISVLSFGVLFVLICAIALTLAIRILQIWPQNSYLMLPLDVISVLTFDISLEIASSLVFVLNSVCQYG
jgi:hypothetical protein